MSDGEQDTNDDGPHDAISAADVPPPPSNAEPDDGMEDDDTNSASKRKRAILLIPGMGQHAHLHRAEALTDNLEAVVQTRHLRKGKPVQIMGTKGFRLIVEEAEDPNTDRAPEEIHVFEAFWSDLLFTVSTSSAWGKLWSGLELIVYWLIHPANWTSRNRLLRVGLIGSAVLMIAWYLTIAMHVASAVGGRTANNPLTKNDTINLERLNPETKYKVVLETGQTAALKVDEMTPEAIKKNVEETKRQNLIDEKKKEAAATAEKEAAENEGWLVQLLSVFIEAMQALAERPWWGLLVLLLGFLKIDRFADNARATKDYLLNRADPKSEKGKEVGLRDKLRQRVVEQLHMVLKDDKYNDIVVVGHSMGAILAIDALREWPHKDDFKRIKLVTIAAPIGLFESRSAELAEDRHNLFGLTSPLFWWRDYNSNVDHYGEKIEQSDKTKFPNPHVEVEVDTWWWQTLIGKPHNSYYRVDRILTDLATVQCGTLEKPDLAHPDKP